jgi:hypothetical protein
MIIFIYIFVVFQEELLSVMTHLVVCAIEDPGVPNPLKQLTILGQNLRQVGRIKQMNRRFWYLLVGRFLMKKIVLLNSRYLCLSELSSIGGSTLSFLTLASIMRGT